MLDSARLLSEEGGHDGLGLVTGSILRVTAVLDGWGAGTWNLRAVGLISAAALWGIRKLSGKKRGVDWYAAIHALISGLGSLACVYLDFVASEKLTGPAEPLRSCQCEGALTSLHRILPAITMGYSLLDILDGLSLGLDFIMHGVVTLSIMAFFVENDVPEFITSMLIMEVSTIFLAIVGADFVPAAVTVTNQAMFVLTFFLGRIVVGPYVWFKLMVTMVQTSQIPEYANACMPLYVPVVSITVGIFYHMLNTFWFVKIIKKARRKLMGQESVRQNKLEGVELTKKDSEDTAATTSSSSTNGSSKKEN